jgi:hypothetical protein
MKYENYSEEDYTKRSLKKTYDNNDDVPLVINELIENSYKVIVIDIKENSEVLFDLLECNSIKERIYNSIIKERLMNNDDLTILFGRKEIRQCIIYMNNMDFIEITMDEFDYFYVNGYKNMKK